MAERNLLTVWARLAFATFADAGVTEIVLSPGSRSTPFMMAAVAEGRLRCHDVIDERAAAFFALGQARILEQPSLLLCTSGTAPAHWYAAILEAEAAHLPLLLMSADRPSELQDCNAPQTIDQVKLFGAHVRKYIELGMPDSSQLSLLSLRRKVIQGKHATLAPCPGAVHFNARARKPLEPMEPISAEERDLDARLKALLSTPAPRVFDSDTHPSESAVEALIGEIGRVERGVIVLGPMPASFRRARDQVFALARATGFPIFCEATSQVRFGPIPEDVVLCDGFDSMLRTPWFKERGMPDFALQLGPVPVSGAWESFHKAELARAVIAPHGWQDPSSSASWVVFSDVAASIESLLGALERSPRAPNRAYAAELARINEAVWEIVERSPGAREWGEGIVVRELMAHIPPGSYLQVGNSLPIRQLDALCRAGGVDVTVLHQRGVNGIDGNIAGALGTCSVVDEPVTLLLGDVSTLHDLTSLGIEVKDGAPFVLVVTNNGGGRIFEQLPLGRHAGLESEPMRHVVTPHPYGFEGAAAMFGAHYARVTSGEELRAALRDAYAARRPKTVIEAVVSPHSALDGMRPVMDELAKLRP